MVGVHLTVWCLNKRLRQGRKLAVSTVPHEPVIELRKPFPESFRRRTADDGIKAVCCDNQIRLPEVLWRFDPFPVDRRDSKPFGALFQ